MAPSTIKLKRTDLAFAIDLPERQDREAVKGLSLLDALRSGKGKELLEVLSKSGSQGRPLDLFLDINEDERVVGIEVLR
ncbi:hypothetical protein [Tritonibacter mobilis]|uniref:hypothetical protein n=1 Tax=Tritonibacter mobilis TaxID=379347 RepID=UPI003990180B